jgi:glucose/arabinose dehydrogenase
MGRTVASHTGQIGDGSSRATAEPLEARRLLAATLPAGFRETRVVTGLDEVTSMDFAPDGRLFVTELDGRVRVVKDGRKLAAPFLSLEVDRYNNRGLIGLTFDPDFEANRYVYVFYSRPDPSTPDVRDNASANRLSRFRASAGNRDVVEAGSEVVLLDDIPNDGGGHNGGALHFGPDGMLYVTTGDSGVPRAAQDLNSLRGKVLRLDVSNPSAGIVPDDNPFAGQSGRRGEVWAYGFRHPYTSAVHPVTGRLFVNDVGADRWEEVNDVRPGKNYGWNSTEGDSSNPSHTDPLLAYPHDGTGAAIVGGTFYTGSAFPAHFHDQYFFADFEDDWVRVLDPDSGAVSPFATGLRAAIDLDVGPDGALYYLAYNDRYSTTPDRSVYKFEYVGGGNRAPAAEFTAGPSSGVAPLEVTFDATASSDPDGDALSYRWDFGDGSSSTAPLVTHTYAEPGQYVPRLTVTDARGLSDTATLPTVDTSNAPPAATVVAPAGGTQYRAGDTIAFGGVATDPEDGTLGPANFSWSIRLFHNTHSHPFLEFDGVASGSFTLPNPPDENEANQLYRVRLTVTDGDGATHSTFVDMTPRTSIVTLASSVPGLELELDGQVVPAGTVFAGVENALRTIGAPAIQAVGGTTYDFAGWSDGGAATHDIATPEDDATYTAVYVPRPIATPGDPGAPPPPPGPGTPPGEPPVDNPPAPTGVDLSVDAVDGVAPGVVGRSGRATIRVANRGVVAFSGPANVELSLSGNADGSGGMPVASLVSKLKLKTGASRPLKVAFAYPPMPADGDYFLIARVTPVDRAADGNAANDVGATAVAVPVRHPVVDLAGTLVPPSRPVARGGRARLSVSVLNAGTEPAAGPLSLTLFAIPQGADPSGPRTALATVTRAVTINPGKARRIALNFVVPPTLAPGAYALLAELDTAGAFAEPDETNNVLVAPVATVIA